MFKFAITTIAVVSVTGDTNILIIGEKIIEAGNAI
jgi:hypothetical protein